MRRFTILYWSARFPLCRKVMVCAHELEHRRQDRRGEAHRLGRRLLRRVREDQSGRLNSGDGAGRRHDDSNSTIICGLSRHHLRRTGAFAGARPARLNVMRRYGFGEGVIDKAIRWVSENLRPRELKSQKVADACRQSVEQTLDLLEREADSGRRGSASTWATSQSAAGLAILDFSVARRSTGAAPTRGWPDYYAHHLRTPIDGGNATAFRLCHRPRNRPAASRPGVSFAGLPPRAIQRHYGKPRRFRDHRRTNPCARADKAALKM